MEWKNVIRYIDWILLIILIGVIIYAQIDGRFINNTIQIVEVCGDQIINNPTGLNITPIYG